MRELKVVLAVVAALLHGLGYLLYARQTKLGRSSPKSASVGIWVFLSIINALTFNVMSGDWVMALQFFTGSVACLVTFFYVLAIGKLKLPTSEEWRLFWFGILASVVWWIFRNASAANLIIFVALVISLIPIYKTLWDDPSKEMPRSWILWTLAFLVTATNVILNWSGKPLNLVMPIGGAVIHGAVAFLSRKSRQARFYRLTAHEWLS
jgi:hypothetical protein